MNTPDCGKCESFVPNFYKKPTAKKLDPRCTHHLARLGRDQDSFMTPTEARLPPSKFETHGAQSANFCGPSGKYFKIKRV